MLILSKIIEKNISENPCESAAEFLQNILVSESLWLNAYYE